MTLAWGFGGPAGGLTYTGVSIAAGIGGLLFGFLWEKNKKESFLKSNDGQPVIAGGSPEDPDDPRWAEWKKFKLTKHGFQRLIERGFTPEEYLSTKSGGQIKTQKKDGAKVFIKEVISGKFNVIVEGKQGTVTALKGISKNH